VGAYDRGDTIEERNDAKVSRSVLKPSRSGDGLVKWEYEQDDVVSIRDDTTYEVVGSPWLELQGRLQGVEDLAAFVPYKLCFNAAGVLDVLCRRVVPTESASLTDREQLS
jgi:hypothetical protein